MLGVGETGQDISYLAVTAPATKEVVLCHRRGFMITPKVIPEPVVAGGWGVKEDSGEEAPRPTKKLQNKPLDCAVAALFDTAYLPGWLQRSGLGWAVHDVWVRVMFWLISGTTAGLDQWVGEVVRG